MIVFAVLSLKASNIFLLTERELDIGFSHQTCLPSLSAAMAISACVSFGVQTETNFTLGSYTTSCQLAVYLENPRSVAL